MPMNPGPSAQSARPPPPIPADPSISAMLSNYLTQFSIWCRAGFADKMKTNIAQPGLMLQAYDAPAGTIPKVFMVQVNSAGTIVTTQMPLGSGSVETP